MNPAALNALLLVIAFAGTTVATECYVGLEFSCSGDDSTCDLIEEALGQAETAKQECGTSACLLSYASATSGNVEISTRAFACAAGLMSSDVESRCYNRDELTELSPELEEQLEQMESMGVKYNDVGACICDTNLCNGVTRTAVSLILLLAPVLVAVNKMIG